MFQLKNYLINKGFSSTYPVGVAGNGRKEVFERKRDQKQIRITRAKKISGISILITIVNNHVPSMYHFDIPEDEEKFKKFIINLLGRVTYKDGTVL